MEEVVITKPIPEFVCAAKGYGVECAGYRTSAHILTRKIKHTKKNPINLITLCKMHESWFNLQPIQVWYRWVKFHYPNNYAEMLKTAKFVLKDVQAFIEVAEEREK